MSDQDKGDPDVVVHGITSCDTVRKARRWLDEHDVPYRFHDLREDGLDAATLDRWIERLDDWGVLVNRRGTTWRRLAEEERADLDRERAIALMAAHPTVIKRPVVERGERVLVGFDEGLWSRLLRA